MCLFFLTFALVQQRSGQINWSAAAHEGLILYNLVFFGVIIILRFCKTWCTFLFKKTKGMSNILTQGRVFEPRAQTDAVLSMLPGLSQFNSSYTMCGCRDSEEQNDVMLGVMLVQIPATYAIKVSLRQSWMSSLTFRSLPLELQQPLLRLFVFCVILESEESESLFSQASPHVTSELSGVFYILLEG